VVRLCTRAYRHRAAPLGTLVGGFTNTIATIPGIGGVAVTGWLLDVTGTYSAQVALGASGAAQPG
jgi:hypothetical protein